MAISVNMYMHSHDFEGLSCIEPHVQGCGLLLHSLGVPRPSVHDGYPVDTYVCMKVHHIIPLSVSERVCAHICDLTCVLCQFVLAVHASE